MKYSYRVTKYRHYQNDKKILYSLPEEWTSFSDIEKDIASIEEYEKIELEYINIILNTCNILNIKSLKIKELTNFNLIKNYKNNQHVDMNNLPDLLKLILREKIWCKLCHRDCEFHFGYDYYLYIICNKDIEKNLKAWTDILNTEKFISPYLKYKQVLRIRPF